jgi:hypothetical protein
MDMYRDDYAAAREQVDALKREMDDTKRALEEARARSRDLGEDPRGEAEADEAPHVLVVRVFSYTERVERALWRIRRFP